MLRQTTFPFAAPPKRPWYAKYIARLLFLANSDPSRIWTYRFYAMKDNILQRWGHSCGYEYQEITHWCWSCHGTGVFREWGGCWKCGCTGIHRRFWVKLERFAFLGFMFHKPVERSYVEPHKVSIKGKIQHGVRGTKCREACLWLALVYDRWLFARMMTDQCETGGWYPLCLVSRLVCAFQRMRQRMRDLVSPNRCSSCGKRIWPWRSDPSFCSVNCKEEVPF